MIKSLHIENYKTFRNFDFDFNDELSIIAGDNEAGKSTILEAVNLALTKQLNGKQIDYEISPFLFNKEIVKEYISSLEEGNEIKPLPRILIELYFNQDFGVGLQGTMNSKKEDCSGVKIEILFDEEYGEDYANLIETQREEIKLIPVEFYTVQWNYFSNNSISHRNIPIKTSFIDATSIHLYNGADYYLQEIIRNELDFKQRASLSIAYRGLKEAFSSQEGIMAINKTLGERKTTITSKSLSISIDISQKSNWESNLIPHLDELPFTFSGKGEQNALKVMLAIERKIGESAVILIEEPENHQSFSSMNILINRIREKCKGKQIVMTTHNAYVLNKLGLNNLILLNQPNMMSLASLSEDTQKYFKILPGYDTLRLVLAKKSILVEGPSDELIVQKAYKVKHSRLPIEDGIDVINVRGLSFPRFLEIAEKLKKNVAVVTDNDGDHKQKVQKKYASFERSDNVKVYYSQDDSLPTLEYHILRANSLNIINTILNTQFVDDDTLLKYMLSNKTECALKVFETDIDLNFPEYIDESVK
jgi:predicted ATP-dependent endonuclease of OLD family